jgi:hypothetical protein
MGRKPPTKEKEKVKIKEIAISRKARKGAAHQITKDGAYWLGINVKIDQRGGDGIGQNAANIDDYFRVRHYRDGSVRAYCESESWHQNHGWKVNRVRCDQSLEAETLEDLITCIKRVPLDRETPFPDDNFNVYFEKQLAEALPELPASAPAPDDELQTNQ